uniref:fasciclin domain-containing protein n=1 Tax=Parerythrobacter lutipelagi TaxID=1964208 RepID=UPI001EFFCEC7|nr:fasciclin domain-containing protein [Parerythrobacter lutipelagi]
MNFRAKFLAVPMLASAMALSACGEPATDAVDANDTETTDAVTDGPGTVVDVASGNPDFSTLVAAVGAANLAETLGGEGPFTVFAPTNAAFEKLPAGTVEDLLKPENQATLTGILTYHVVAGTTDAAALTKAITDNGGSAELTTVNGGVLTAKVDGENVVLTDSSGNSSTVTATDVAASNGVIHVIDTVVMPASE